MRGGLTLREAILPGRTREDAIRNIRQHYERLAASLDPAVEELRGIVAAHEPVQLISSIVIPANMRLFGRGDALSDAPDTVSWPAKIEYLVGVALSLPAGTGSTPMAVSRHVMDLVSDVFDAMHAREMIGSFDRESSGNNALDEAVFMLRMEHLVDRMPGYAVHLERIDAEIFDRHSSFYIDTLGFNPGDVVRVVRRRGQAVQQRADQALSQARRFAGRDIESSTLAALNVVQTMTESRTWTPAQVAVDTGVSEAQISKMLAFFATTFGAQPEFRLPTDSNLARTHPVIDLGAETYFIPDTWTMAAAVHPRLAAASSDGALRRYTTRDLLASAAQSAEVAQGRYKAGVGSILDLLTAQSALANARSEEAQARSLWFLSVAQLAHATGVLQPGSPEIRALPSGVTPDAAPAPGAPPAKGNP